MSLVESLANPVKVKKSRPDSGDECQVGRPSRTDLEGDIGPEIREGCVEGARVQYVPPSDHPGQDADEEFRSAVNADQVKGDRSLAYYHARTLAHFSPGFKGKSGQGLRTTLAMRYPDRFSRFDRRYSQAKGAINGLRAAADPGQWT